MIIIMLTPPGAGEGPPATRRNPALPRATSPPREGANRGFGGSSIEDGVRACSRDLFSGAISRGSFRILRGAFLWGFFGSSSHRVWPSLPLIPGRRKASGASSLGGFDSFGANLRDSVHGSRSSAPPGVQDRVRRARQHPGLHLPEPGVPPEPPGPSCRLSQRSATRDTQGGSAPRRWHGFTYPVIRTVSRHRLDHVKSQFAVKPIVLCITTTEAQQPSGEHVIRL